MYVRTYYNNLYLHKALSRSCVTAAATNLTTTNRVCASGDERTCIAKKKKVIIIILVIKWKKKLKIKWSRDYGGGGGRVCSALGTNANGSLVLLQRRAHGGTPSTGRCAVEGKTIACSFKMEGEREREGQSYRSAPGRDNRVPNNVRTQRIGFRDERETYIVRTDVFFFLGRVCEGELGGWYPLWIPVVFNLVEGNRAPSDNGQGEFYILCVKNCKNSIFSKKFYVCKT